MDLAALVIVAAISGLCFQGLYRLVFGSTRRVILPPTEANLPEYETETLRVRRERSSGRRADRSNVSIPSQGLGEGNEILGKGINEAVVSDAGVSAFNDRLKREGAKRGAVQVSLLWNNWNDLDLHLITPSGEHIFHDNRKSACGGELDLDMNFKPTSKTPVENIVWTKTPPPGTYRVGVRHYKVQHKNMILAKIPLISKFILKNETEFKVSVTVGDSQRVYEGIIEHHKVGSELLFVAKFAIAETKEGDLKPKEIILKSTKDDVSKAIVSNKSVSDYNLSVKLSWDGENDLGLSVVSPVGKKISYLDIGNNTDGVFNFVKEQGLQSITWDQKPESGKYSISVNQYEISGENKITKFKTFVTNSGEIEEFEGSISEDGENIEVGSFNIS